MLNYLFVPVVQIYVHGRHTGIDLFVPPTLAAKAFLPGWYPVHI